MIQVVLIVILLTVVAYLSIPGVVRYHPLLRVELMPWQSTMWQRLISFALIFSVIIGIWSGVPEWTGINPGAVISIVVLAILIPLVAHRMTRAETRHDKLALYHGLHLASLQRVSYYVFTILYMVIYEALLRGIVFYFLIDRIGVMLAIVITTLIYVLMHLPKDHTESLLCIPAGIGLCVLTYTTGSIWPAAVFHALIAVSFEYFYSRRAALSTINSIGR